MTREEVLERIIDPKGLPESAADQREIEAWLEKDAELRAAYESQQQLWASLELWTPAEPSASFDRQVYARIEAHEQQPRWWSSWVTGWRPSLAVAALALALAAVNFTVQRSIEEPETKTAAATMSPEDAEYLRALEGALDDVEMLVDFDALAPPEASEGRS